MSSLQANITVFAPNHWDKFPPSIQDWDSNSQPSENYSPPITTKIYVWSSLKLNKFKHELYSLSLNEHISHVSTNFLFVQNTGCKSSNWFSWSSFKLYIQNVFVSKWFFTNKAYEWTFLTCLFNFLFSPNDLLQIKQLYGLSFSWTVLTCVFKFAFCPNDMLQIKQLNGLLFSWMVLTCVF